MTETKNELVLVTGANGFIAGHIIQQLCEKGYQVRATTRKFNESQQQYILDLAQRPNQIEFVNCDLTKDENWDKAVKGVKYVIHTASPMPDTDMGKANDDSSSKDKKRKPVTDDDFINPAVDGMNRVLNAILNYGKSVERVVYTSSVAAINWGCWDTFGSNKKIVYSTSDNWTPVDKYYVSPYAKSKTYAEKTAIEFVKNHNNPFELVTIQPGVVIGPLLHDRMPLSLGMVQKFLDGEFPFIPPIQWGIVDVRDVAAAHVNSLKASNAAGKRYLLVNECVWHKDIAALMRYKYGKLGYPIPVSIAPKILLQLVSFFDAEIRYFVLPSFELKRFIDHRPSVEDLSIYYRPVQDTIVETCEDLIARGLVKKPVSQTKRMVRKALIAGITVGVTVGSIYAFGGKEKLQDAKAKIVGWAWPKNTQ